MAMALWQERERGGRSDLAVAGRLNVVWSRAAKTLGAKILRILPPLPTMPGGLTCVIGRHSLPLSTEGEREGEI